MLVSRHAQHLIFGEKLRILGNGGEIFNPKSFKILHPFLDENKLLKYAEIYSNPKQHMVEN
jgi:hypothetical protein